MTSENSSSQLQLLMQEGVIAQQRGDFATAETRYREVLHVMPEHADATHFLGLLAHQTGHPQPALELLERSVLLGPGSALYRHNLAGVLREQGKLADAEARYREALALKADYEDALIGLALVQMTGNRFEDALQTYRQLLLQNPENFDARLGCGAALLELARRTEALQCYRDAQTWAAGNPDQLHRLGLVWREAGMAEEARYCFSEALTLRPDFVEAYNSLGIALADLGDLPAAEGNYREALRLRPDYLSAWHNLVGIKKLTRNDSLWAGLQALSGKATTLSVADAGMLHFVLGKANDDIGEHEKAFEHYLEANRLKRSTINYDELRQIRFFEEFIRYFDAPSMAAHAGSGIPSDLPVFIVGMPRSGTTLVEQILASHPKVHGAGELHLLRRCLRVELGLVEDDDQLPQYLSRLPTGRFKDIGARYCAALSELAPLATRITDKLPGNMALVGLIHLVFPNARIIHCVREPLDTCVSCFSKLFTTGHAFSYDLAELGRFYRLHEKLMTHWHSVLPAGRMLEVRYEEMVSDTEEQVHRLLEYCGLDWDDACMRFNETRRPVKTASLAQVRQPIYTSAQGRWKHYRNYLAPLEGALAGD